MPPTEKVLVLLIFVSFGSGIDDGAGRAAGRQFRTVKLGRNRRRNAGKIFFNGDFRADFGAFHAGNAGGFAVFAGGCAFLFVAAGHINHYPVFSAGADFV